MDEFTNGPDLSGNQPDPQEGNPQEGNPQYTQPPYQQNYTQPEYTQPEYQQPPQPDYGQPYQQGYYQQTPPPPMGYQQKSKVAAGLLGIFLGAFGVHNFYLGYTGKAVAQLLITVLTCGVGSVASGIWGFIEGIMLLTGSINVDGNNIPLRD